MRKKIVIIGSGIAAITLGSLLKSHSNFDVMVYEREKILSLDDGYGIQLSPNSVSILNKIGFSNISNNKPGLILPEYTRVDFAAYYDVSEDLAIRLNIENLTDKVYFPHSHSTHQASVGEEVNARLSITRRF